MKFRNFYPADFEFMVENVPGFRPQADMRGLVAFDEETGEIAAAFTLHAWTHTSAQANWIIKNKMALRHGFLEEIGRYMFDIAKRDKVFAVIPDNNKASVALAKKVGFQEYARMKDGWDKGVDFVLLEGTRDTYKYWPNERMAA